MEKTEEAKTMLIDLGMPESQQNLLSCYVFIALSGIKQNSQWAEATDEWIRIHDIIEFIRVEYNRDYAENTRETIRKNSLHQFREAALIEDNSKPTNSPSYRYRITKETLNVIRSFGTLFYKSAVEEFSKKHNALKDRYANLGKRSRIKINLGDMRFYHLSIGNHNALQKAIVEVFAPRFIPKFECLYLGDSTDRDMISNAEKLLEVGIEINSHDKMPDVILYRPDKEWLYFIEAVTTVGPISPQRLIEIKKMSRNSHCGKVFITAFLDFETFKRFSGQLAWETEVWISEQPEHLIHLDGDKLLEPR